MYNQSTIIGRLGEDPVVRFTKSQKAVTTISVATTETWKDNKTGEKKEQTEWHRVVLFGKQAENAGEYLKKGSLALFEGPIRSRKWQDQNGHDRYTTEIHAGVMKMMPSNGKSSGQTAQNSSLSTPTSEQSFQPGVDSYDDFDEIPF